MRDVVHHHCLFEPHQVTLNARRDFVIARFVCIGGLKRVQLPQLRGRRAIPASRLQGGPRPGARNAVLHENVVKTDGLPNAHKYLVAGPGDDGLALVRSCILRHDVLHSLVVKGHHHRRRDGVRNHLANPPLEQALLFHLVRIRPSPEALRMRFGLAFRKKMEPPPLLHFAQRDAQEILFEAGAPPNGQNLPGAKKGGQQTVLEAMLLGARAPPRSDAAKQAPRRGDDRRQQGRVVNHACVVADRDETLVRPLRRHRAQQVVLPGGVRGVQPVHPHAAQRADARHGGTPRELEEHAVGRRVVNVGVAGGNARVDAAKIPPQGLRGFRGVKHVAVFVGAFGARVPRPITVERCQRARGTPEKDAAHLGRMVSRVCEPRG